MIPKPDPYKIDGVKRHHRKPYPWLTVFVVLIVAILGLVILSPIPEKIRRKLGWSASQKEKKPEPPVKPEIIYKERVVEKTVKVGPPYYEVKNGTDVSKTSKGFDYRFKVEENAGRLASDERIKDGSYEASLTFSVNRPEPAKRFDEIVKVNSELPKILPGLEALIDRAKVSPFYGKLYDNKRDRIKRYANRFDRVLTKHNYFDCQTMLELEDPRTKQKVFLMQADMDVVSDGSDGDRLPTMPEKIVNSSYYQPFTSYGWRKTGAVENPMIVGWRKLLEKAKAAGNADEVKRLTTGIEDLKRRSFLIAEYDPFIVISVDIIGDRESAWGPNVGDFVAVIFGKKVYPAIVGDGGPSFKAGEASLRMAKELNPNATSYSRPVSSVSVTYLVFPRSSGTWQAPNYESWRSECDKLLEKIGGLGEGYELHQWKNTLPEQEAEPE